MASTHGEIVPHLWFDHQAKEAAAFYSSVFPESRIAHTSIIHDTPSGDCDIVSMDLWGQPFMAISAGPLFQFNPSQSFIVNFDPLLFGNSPEQARQAIDETWAKLSDGGTTLMPLDQYPFSERYGWVQDRYGLSWQLILSNPEGEPRPAIVPSLLFAGEQCGNAEAAMQHYLSLFENARQGQIARYGAGQEPNREGTIMFADFRLKNTWFAVMDSALQHDFAFNESVSFVVKCDTQADIDYYWQGLSAIPESEQCGWLKDRFGVSWQIVPAEMETMMRQGTDAQRARLTRAFLEMKKLDLEALRATYAGGSLE